MRRTFAHRDAGEGTVSESRHPFAVRLDIAVKYRSAVNARPSVALCPQRVYTFMPHDRADAQSGSENTAQSIWQSPMTSTKSTKIPKGWEEFYANMTAMTDRFCQEHLNQEYGQLARYAIAALCRKRPSPLVNGHPRTWACAVLYALGQVNFLSDKSTAPYMAMADLCAHFDIASSTGGNKAKLVRKALGIRQFDHRWTLPSRLADSPMAWMIEIDGLVVDARRLPLTIQEVAFKRGIIPYVVPHDVENEE